MVLSSWQSHCESSPGSFDECRMAPSGRRPKTKPDDLGCESACTGCQKLHRDRDVVTKSTNRVLCQWQNRYRKNSVPNCMLHVRCAGNCLSAPIAGMCVTGITHALLESAISNDLSDLAKYSMTCMELYIKTPWMTWSIARARPLTAELLVNGASVRYCFIAASVPTVAYVPLFFMGQRRLMHQTKFQRFSDVPLPFNATRRIAEWRYRVF